ncbi:Tyrosine-protein kinase [Aphelenchoides fujianensis]|nr:Tyrosine-protein kinase [Aphelenchoides fujianensis]
MACEQPPVIVLLELCPGGSLLSLLRQWAPAISTAERVKFAVEAAEGMVYLHQKGIIHRDLAARNCLIGRHGAVKIADFGLSQVISEAVRRVQSGEQIPCRWMAPESLYARAVFSLKTDVWAFGVLLYEIFNDGGKPWPDWPNKKIATWIRKGRMPALPARTPAAVAELVQRRCWVLEAEARSTMVPVKEELEAIQAAHPYVLEELAVNRIPGVRAVSAALMRAAQAEFEDIERDGREPTVEEPTGTTTNTATCPPSRHFQRRSARRSRTETGHFEEAPQPTASKETPQTSRKSRKSARSGKSTAQPAAKPPQGNENDLTNCSETTLKVQWGPDVQLQLWVDGLPEWDTVEWSFGDECTVQVESASQDKFKIVEIGKSIFLSI